MLGSQVSLRDATVSSDCVENRMPSSVQLRKRIGLGFGTYNPRLQRAIRLLIETNLITSLVVIAELITFLQRATASWYFLL